MKRILFTTIAIIALSTFTFATVISYQGFSGIGTQLGQATFDGLETYDPLQNYMEDGLTLDVDDFAYVFQPPGMLPGWTPPYYPNGGVEELISIARTDSMDFSILEMNISHGFAGTSLYVWAQAFLDGNLEAEFDIDVTAGTLIGFSGTFDQLRIGAYTDAASRNAHNIGNLNAAALDNVAFGHAIPEPATFTLILLGLGVLALLRRR